MQLCGEDVHCGGFHLSLQPWWGGVCVCLEGLPLPPRMCHHQLGPRGRERMSVLRVFLAERRNGVKHDNFEIESSLNKQNKSIVMDAHMSNREWMNDEKLGIY